MARIPMCIAMNFTDLIRRGGSRGKVKAVQRDRAPVDRHRQWSFEGQGTKIKDSFHPRQVEEECAKLCGTILYNGHEFRTCKVSYFPAIILRFPLYRTCKNSLLASLSSPTLRNL